MRSLRPHWPSLLATALVALVSWPVTGDMRPRLDLDGAWEVGLRQAAHDGLNFGPEVLFTYGPLGFLREPLLVYPWTARLAFVYGLAVHVALSAGLIWGLRHALGSLIAAALAAVLLAGALYQEPTVVVGFLGAVALAAGRARERRASMLALGLGVLAGIELLAKLNAGVTLAALGVVAVVAAPAPRRALAGSFAGGLLAAVALGWLASGQAVSAVGDYLSGSLAIVSGYSEAMYYEEPGTDWELWVACATVGLGYAVAWRAGDRLAGRARLGLLALWTVLAFMSAKAGFVRHDPSHANIFFASTLGGLVAFGWAPHRRLTAVLIGLLGVTTMFASLGSSPRNFVQPWHRSTHLVEQAWLLARPGATRAAIEEARRAHAAWEQLDPALRAAAAAGTVHVEPVEAAAAWAQRLRWRPLPVFHTYSAYTSALDERNADAVRDPRGPDRILREDGIYLDRGNPVRSAEIDAPAANRAMLCHFRPGRLAGRWLVLERTAPRCGAPRLLARATATLGTPARIPAAPDARSAVFVRIDGIGVDGLERLRAALYRALPRAIGFDGNRTFRLLPGTAADGLVLRVPAAADFPGPFALDQATETLTLTRALDRDRVRLRFYAMAIR